MRKISRKIIQLKYADYIKNKGNFSLVSIDSIKDLNKDLDIVVYKKGLYKYILPGQFPTKIKTFFKKHTYIDYELNKDNIKNVINNKSIVLINYNNQLFLNNETILKHLKPYFKDLFKNALIKVMLPICLMFYID